MNHRNLFLFFSFLFYLFAADVSAQSISGTVKATNGAGIANVWVGVYNANANLVASGKTKADGTYTVNELPPADNYYKVEFYGQDQGYFTQWYNNKGDFNSANTVSVTDGTNTPNINAVLHKGGSISGKVTANGAGIANVPVGVYNAGANLVDSGKTASNGNYTVNELPNGIYKVLFYGPNAGYAYQWYNNKSNFSSANTVSVTAPNNTGGIDAVLTTGGSISGTVTDKNQTPLNGVKVCACDPDAIEEYVCGYTGADGSYQLSNLPTGTIKVEFYGQDKGYFNQWYNNKGDFNSANTVSVTDGTNTPNINAVLYKGGSISGTVTANGAGIGNIVVGIFDTNADLFDLTVTQADGTYTVDGLPPADNYKVEFFGQDKGYINQWYNNKGDFNSANTVSVTDGTETPNINAVLTTGGSISGTVTANGAGIGNLLVEVYGVNNTLVSSIYTAADGTYTVDGLPR